MQVEELAGMLEALAPKVAGQMVSLASLDGSEEPGSPSLRGVCDGHPFTIALFDVPGPRDHFTVAVDATLPFTLTLHKEGRWDWLRKAMGQLDDYEVGLAEIDRDFIVGGQPRHKVVDYLHRPEVQQRLHEAHGFLSLGVDHGFLRATFPVDRPEAWTPEELLGLTRCLVELTRLAEES